VIRPAVRVGDMHVCSGGKGPVVSGLASLLVDERPIARVGDEVECSGGTNHQITEGVPSKLGAGLLVGFVGCRTTGTGFIVSGSPDMLLATDSGPDEGVETTAAHVALIETYVAQRCAPDHIDGCAERLAARAQQIEAEGYQPKYTNDELVGFVRYAIPEPRYLVRFEAVQLTPDGTPDANRPLGYLRPSGRLPVWSTDFDQLEAAGLDPERIAALLATDYNPEKSYALVIIEDLGPDHETNGEATIIPTHENLAEVAAQETDRFSPEIFHSILSAEYAADYTALAEKLRDLAAPPELFFNRRFSERFCETHIPDPDERKKFSARHWVNLELGANAEFTGVGLTQSRLAPNPDDSLNYGAIEYFKLQRYAATGTGPPTLAELEARDHLRIVQLPDGKRRS